MAALGALAPQTVNDIQEETGAAMVNQSNESSSLPPVVAQPEHSSRSLGNKSTNGNSEAGNTQRDAVVFSFRDYILGTVSNTGVTQEMKMEIQGAQNLEVKPEEEKEKQKDAPLPIQLNTTDSFQESQTDVPFTDQRDDLRQENVDSNKAKDKNGTLDCSPVIGEKGMEVKTRTDTKVENQSDDASTVCIVETGEKGDLSHDAQEGGNLYFMDANALSEMQKEDISLNKEPQVMNTDAWGTLPSGTEAEANKEAKKKEKKKKRRKKKTESNAGNKQEELEAAVQPENNLRALSVEDAGKHTDLVENMQSLKEADIVSGGEQPGNGLSYTQQLSPGGEPVFSPPPSSSPNRQDHLTHSARSHESGRASLQRPHQSDDHNMSDTLCDMNHCSGESPQQEEHVTAAASIGPNTAVTYVQTPGVGPSASADGRPDARTQEVVVTSGTAILLQEKQSPLSNSRICVGESGVEVTLEEALVPVAALPVNTPTMPEVIGSEGSGESVRCDSLERVATVALGESEKAAEEADLRVADKCFSHADERTEGLPDYLPQLSLIRSQENCTLAFSATVGRAVTEESCSSKMPHNSFETETKGLRETSVFSADAEVSPAEEGAREKEQPRPEAFIDTSPRGVLTGPDCQDHSAVGLERAGGGGGGGGGGGVEEEEEKKGGRTKEHSPLGQPEGSPHGVSSAETETCPPSNVAESPLESQCRSEPIPTVTESLGTEKDRLSQPCQEQRAAAISPRLTHPEQSSSNTNEGVRADLKLDVISEEGLSLEGISEESSIAETERDNSQVFLPLISPQPPTASQQIPVDRQQASNNQQVQPESSTTGARTTDAGPEFRAQTQVNSDSSAMSEAGLHVSKSGGRNNNKVRFADTVKQEGSFVVNLKKMAGLAMDCASIPPLTVHESLHHPVVEESYIFPNFLSTQKPEILAAAAPAKNEPAIQSSAGLTTPQQDSQLDDRDTGTKEAKENLNPDQSGNKNTGDSQCETEASLSQRQGPIEEEQNTNEECFVIPKSSVFEADHLTGEDESEKATKQSEARRETDGVKEKETDKPHVQSEQPLGSPFILDVKLLLSSCAVLPPHDLNEAVNEKTTEHPFTESDRNSKPQTVTPTCATSVQTKPSDPSCQPPTQTDEVPLCWNTDPRKGAFDSSNLTKGELNLEEDTALDQPAPAIEQYATKPTSVPLSPGPMLSHLEFTTDCDISLPEQTDNHGADGGSTEVQGERSGEMTRMSLAQDIMHSDISVKAEQTGLRTENRTDAVESDALVGTSLIDNVNIPQEECNVNISQKKNSPPAAATAHAGLDYVISQTHSESGGSGIKPVICESPTTDDPINISCPLSSDLPTEVALDENKRECVKEEQKTEGERDVPFQEEKERVQDSAAGNQKETGGKLQPGQTQQQGNGPDKEAVEEIGDPQPAHQLKDTEPPMKDINEDGVVTKRQREICALSSDRKTILPENLKSPSVEFGGESQTVCHPDLHPIHSATLECSPDWDTAQSAALGQSQSAPDPSCFAQQQNQQQRCPSSSLPLEVSPGGCLERGEEAKSQVSQTQELFAQIKVAAEAVDGSVGSVRPSGTGDNLTGDVSGGKEVMGFEEDDGEGTQAAPEVGRDYSLPPPVSHINETALSDIGELTACSHVGDTGQEGVVGSAQDSGFLSDLGGKGQQKSNIPAVCQDQGGIPEASKNTAVSVPFPSQEHEISPFGLTVTSAVNTESRDIHTGVFSSSNQAEEIQREIPSVLPDPESVESDSSAAKAVNGNGIESEKCDIQHTVCEALEVQSPNIPLASQSSQGATAPVKGPDVEEITKEDKAALVKGEVSSPALGRNEIKAIKKEEMEKEEVVNPDGSEKVSGLDVTEVSALGKSEDSHHGTGTSDCHVVENTFPPKAAECDDDATDKTTPDPATASPVVSSECVQDFASTPPAAPIQTEKPYDPVTQSKPQDDTVVETADACSEFQECSLQNSSAGNSLAEQDPVKAETPDALESPAPGLGAQEPGTSWINALKEAAAQNQSTQENTVDTSR